MSLAHGVAAIVTTIISLLWYYNGVNELLAVSSIKSAVWNFNTVVAFY